MDINRLKKLILPLIMEQLFAVSVGLIDTIMVSHVGEAAISGVSLVDSINLFILQVMAALSAGGMVVISQYLGNQNHKMVQKACAHLEMMMLLFAAIIMVLCVVFGRGLLGFLFGKVEPAVMEAGVTYLMISGLSFLFWGMYSSGAAILRCHEDTKTAMKVSLLMNIINVVLNAYFVFGMQMGVLGVAVATLISRGVAGIIMKGVLLSKKNPFRIQNRSMYKPSWQVAKSILSMGIPSGIENGMFHVGKIMVTSMIATLATSAIAANSISYQIIEFPNIAGNTIGLALVVIVGQDIGAGNKDMALRDAKYMLKLAYIGDWICKLTLFVIAPYIVALFSLTPGAKEIAVLVLRCFSIASLPIWPLSFTLPNVLRGAGDVKYSMMVSVISMWLCRVLVSYLLVMVFHLGVLGVWIGMFADWYARGCGYYARFRSRKWLDKKVV